MNNDILVTKIRELILELVIGNYDALEKYCSAERLNAHELKQAVIEYGCTLTLVPDEELYKIKLLPVTNLQGTWVADIDMWTKEEGKSDLTLSITIHKIDNDYQIEIDDLHVL